MRKWIVSLMLATCCIVPINCFAWLHDNSSVWTRYFELDGGSCYYDARSIRNGNRPNEVIVHTLSYNPKMQEDVVFVEIFNMKERTSATAGYVAFDKNGKPIDKYTETPVFFSLAPGYAPEKLYEILKSKGF